MNFADLKNFVSNRMRMSHIYQPVFLTSLLENGGRSSEADIARALLIRDKSQEEYYASIVNNMPGRVLRKHGIVQRDKTTKTYTLMGFDSLSNAQRETLVDCCKARLDEFIAKHGDSVPSHRQKSAGYISGTIRYEVLKRAKFRCELCGISAENKALEADHILPRNHGGTDDIENLQALCYSCNAMKRDRDDTDFRRLQESYSHREEDCLFCNSESDRIVAENNLAYVIQDGYPVTASHTLIIPKRHVSTYFELGQAEINAINQLMSAEKDTIEGTDNKVSGFNVGINCGENAGQTIFHCHVHLIPRRDGDVPEPRGGIRHVIPGKDYY